MFRVTPRNALLSGPPLRRYPARFEPGQGIVWPLEAAYTAVELTGQEFLLFREVRTDEDIARLASTYGPLGLGLAAVNAELPYPTWLMRLTRNPQGGFVYKHKGGAKLEELEPTEDWVRQSGLLCVGVALLGLSQSARARRALRTVLSGRRTPKRDDPELWPVRELLDGCERAGLGVSQEDAWQGGFLLDPLDEPRWLKDERISDLGVLVEDNTSHAFATALAGLLDPWTTRIRLGVSTDTKGLMLLSPGTPAALLAQLWLQLADAAFGDLPLKVCAWEGCKGPHADRPGVFLWRWPISREDIKHRDAQYCDRRCAHADAQAASRGRESLARKQTQGPRVCQHPDCITQLRQSNRGRYCSMHSRDHAGEPSKGRAR